jgi:ethylbenzene dioxygenase subunit beta
MSPPPNAISRVQEFLYRECRLLDDHRFEEWLSMFEPDGHYWVPMTWGQNSPVDHVSLIYETMDLLTLRIGRLMHKKTASQFPASRTIHQLGNVEIEDWTDNSVITRSLMTYVEYRRNEQRLFAGIAHHTLVPRSDSFGIKHKRVDLLNCDADVGHIRMNVPF